MSYEGGRNQQDLSAGGLAVLQHLQTLVAQRETDGNEQSKQLLQQQEYGRPELHANLHHDLHCQLSPEMQQSHQGPSISKPLAQERSSRPSVLSKATSARASSGPRSSTPGDREVIGGDDDKGSLLELMSGIYLGPTGESYFADSNG